MDGVVSLFGFDHTSPPPGFPVSVDGSPHWLSAGAGARLSRLARTFECVWCTGWEERAEEHLPYFLGLPGGWEHLSFDRPRAQINAHWKLDAIDAFAGPTGRWRGSTTTTTTRAGRGPRRGRRRRCWSPPTPPWG